MSIVSFAKRLLKQRMEVIYGPANWVEIRMKDVRYATYPVVKGRLQLQGEGVFRLGRDVRFNSTTRANFVGLYKPCSIAVMKDAVLEIGDYSGFSGVSIYCTERIVIGKHVNCGGNVSIWDTDFHPLDYRERRAYNVQAVRNAPIHIGDDAFIGAHSIILKGVTIGERSIIGAGSVVTKNIPPDEVWGGNPARYIRSLGAGDR